MKARTVWFGLYGTVRLIRAVCPDCASTALVQGGKTLCCDVAVDDPTAVKRESQPDGLRRLPSPEARREILDGQDRRCFYCAKRFGAVVYRRRRRVALRINWDHWVPFAYLQGNPTHNFVAACHVCNELKGSRIFQTVDEARVQIRLVAESKGYAEAPE